jgi:hypothetical protein
MTQGVSMNNFQLSQGVGGPTQIVRQILLAAWGHIGDAESFAGGTGFVGPCGDTGILCFALETQLEAAGASARAVPIQATGTGSGTG